MWIAWLGRYWSCTTSHPPIILVTYVVRWRLATWWQGPQSCQIQLKCGNLSRWLQVYICHHQQQPQSSCSTKCSHWIGTSIGSEFPFGFKFSIYFMIISVLCVVLLVYIDCETVVVWPTLHVVYKVFLEHNYSVRHLLFEAGSWSLWTESNAK